MNINTDALENIVGTKPIAVIYFPDDYAWSAASEVVNCIALMQELNGWGNRERSSGDDLSQYIWFCFHKSDITSPELKVFHEKDFTEIQYEELKNLVLEHLKNSTL